MILDKIENVIFDLDGTLIDSSEGVIIATNYALESVGAKPRSDDEIKSFIGYPLDVMFPEFCDAPIEELKRAFQKRGLGLIVDKARALPGVDELLAYLYSQNICMAMATTKFRHHTVGTVEKLGWTKFFTALASGDEVAEVKPAPDIIHLAIKKISADPDRTIMVGDTINDIIAAQTAGIKVIAIKSPFGNDDLSAHKPDLILDNPDQLRALFEKRTVRE